MAVETRKREQIEEDHSQAKELLEESRRYLSRALDSLVAGRYLECDAWVGQAVVCLQDQDVTAMLAAHEANRIATTYLPEEK